MITKKQAEKKMARTKKLIRLRNIKHSAKKPKYLSGRHLRKRNRLLGIKHQTHATPIR